MGSARVLGVVTVACAIAIALMQSVQMTPITGHSDTLGASEYNMQKIVAPAADGRLLHIISYFLTHTGFLGHVIRRFLLNKNGMHLVRELAAQVPDSVEQIFVPIERLNTADHHVHTLAAKASHPEAPAYIAGLKSKAIRYGDAGQRVPPDPLGKGSAAEAPRRTEDYIKMYKKCPFGVGSCTLPSEAIGAVLERIPALEAQLGRIFVAVDHEGAMRDAAASDVRWRKGQPLSMFDGVPVAVKDMLAIRGLRRTDGSVVPAEQEDVLQPVEQEDDVLVKRFRDAGAIILGSTTMTEFGITPMGWSVHHQGPRNPYNPRRYPGGSSAGSGVAVAVGLVPVAIGYDGGGSIRVPAALSGVVGLATTKGRIPSDDHHTSSVVKAGPMAASARDAALAYTLMAQVHPTNPYTTMYGGDGPPTPHLVGFDGTEDLSDVRLGVYTDWYTDAEPDIVKAVSAAVAALEARGATVVRITIPHMQQLRLSHAIAISSEMAGSHDGQYHSIPSKGSYWWLDANTRISLGIAQTFSAVEYYAANRVRSWAVAYVRQLFKDNDLTAIVTPTVGEPPSELTAAAVAWGSSDTAAVVNMMRHIFLANLLGLPAISVPVGYDAEGFPVGLLAMSAAWEEAKLLRLAHALETFHFSYKL